MDLVTAIIVVAVAWPVIGGVRYAQLYRRHHQQKRGDDRDILWDQVALACAYGPFAWFVR